MTLNAKQGSWRHCAAAALLIVAGFYVFWNLGAYYLWDDEAAQAMLAEQVWKTGDTSAVVGRNIIAYNQGSELEGLKDRANSPLPSYLMAPLMAGHEGSRLFPRLLFAACGFAFVAFFSWALWREDADGTTWLVFAMAILGNAAMFLLFRQARYYGITLLCSLVLGYKYLRWNGSRRSLVGMSLLLFCLMASHLITYAGVCATLVVDYIAWRRKERPLGWGDWAAIVLPQAVLGAALLSVWNPFGTGVGGSLFANSFAERARLFWWNLRDLNANEFICTGLVLGAPLLYALRHRCSYLWRGPLAVVIYCATIALISPKVMRLTWPFADCRYLTPMIPLSIALGAMVVRLLADRVRWVALPLGLVAFGTNLLNFGPLLDDRFHPGPRDGFHAAPVLLAGELVRPVPGPYGAALEWMSANMPAGASVWVLPGWDNYPLMYHAPQFIYAWQLGNPPAAPFRNLDPIHFYGVKPPDYVVAFGTYVDDACLMMAREREAGVYYDQVALLPHYWMNLHRPAVIHHAFRIPEVTDPNNYGIYIYRRKGPLSATNEAAGRGQRGAR